MKKLSYAEVIASDPFAGDGVNLDLSGFPDYAALETPKEDPFAPRLNGYANALKNFASNPTDEVLQELASRTGDQDIVAEIKDRQELAEAEIFLAKNPAYYRTDENFDRLNEYLAEKKLPFVASNLTAAFKALTKSGELETAPGQTRKLTASEDLAISRKVTAGQLEDALWDYLRARIGPFTSDPTIDPNYREVCEDAAWFIFENSTPDFVPTKAAREFFQDFISGRVVTLPILRAGHSAWKKQESRAERSLNNWHPEAQPATADAQTISKSFEDMSDDQLDRAVKASYREHFKQVRGI
jgi:hypothetical protein